MSIILSFDIGYASIGWCALDSSESVSEPEFLATGVVTFPTDDCLASKRRDLRRSRRHVRSTRQRIENMKRWLIHRKVLTRRELDKPGHPAPFLLAAAAISGQRILNPWELWTTLRWYAHNRGYDGNSRWSGGEAAEDDTAKEVAAKALMSQHQTSTMAETICACLGLDPKHSRKKISSHLPYKTLNAAFPRVTVQSEVYSLLQIHRGKIPGLDDTTLDLLFTPEGLSERDRATLQLANIRLPKRYCGGLLFGQLIPRFDNRIISRCPITWAKTYDEEISAGRTDPQARKMADKLSKVPAAKSKEFLEYRFARVLANIRANGKPIDKEVRAHLWDIAEGQGRLSHSDIEKTLIEHYGPVSTNLEAYFKLHPDSEEALVINPVRDEIRKAEGSRARLSPFWKHLAPELRKAIEKEWEKGRGISLAWIAENAGENPALNHAFAKEFAALKPKKGEVRFSSITEYLQATRVAPKIPSGRAPYARPVLRQVVDEVKNGWDSTKANHITDPEDGENKQSNGVLYAMGIPKSRPRQLQNERPIDQLTNNHLVRHRMLILERLLDDIASEFVTEKRPVTRVVVEVARELSQFSGMTAKQIATELNSRLKDFKSAVDHLSTHAPNLKLNGSIIRKARIAMDMNWFCPFTGEKYEPTMLPDLEREHIIPYASRSTNALHALVLTFPEVNRMKGKRTAKQFILESAELPSRQVPGLERLTLFTPRQYEVFVEKLDTKGHSDDSRRKRARKLLLSTAEFEDKELGFTEGALTKTSHLTKLALRGLHHRFPDAHCDPIPGPVTAEIRKAWDLVGTLSCACPEVIDPKSGEVLTKNEIRGVTHLHHALDAATIALAAHYFPFQFRGEDQKGRIWRILLRRRRSAAENDFLYRLGIFDRFKRVRRDKDGKEYEETDVRLRDLPKSVKDNLSRSLAQCRVAQHLPADRSGAKAELNTWGIVTIEGDGEDARVKLRQKSTAVESGVRKRTVKNGEERAGKLLGLKPKNGTGKLQAIKGVLVIGDNYGLALDPSPTVIPFHNVCERLAALIQANDGKPIRILRNGMLIQIRNWPGKEGIWRIMSCKASLKLDLARPQEMKATWREVAVASLVARGLKILPRRYSGHPVGN